jgi:deoxyadenosine/deoxycytidine kinase
VIIALEGVNGVGKTTYAIKLSNELGIRVCRSFHADNYAQHWGSEDRDKLMEKLRDMRVPINTHVDDLYAADFITMFGVDAILDRPVTSAIVYGRVFNQNDGWYKQPGRSESLLEFWSNIIDRDDRVLYVQLEASYQNVKSRIGSKRSMNKTIYRKLSNEYDKLFHKIRFEKMKINTSVIDIEYGVESIIKFMRDDANFR